jgi:hypothetical protein
MEDRQRRAELALNTGDWKQIQRVTTKMVADVRMTLGFIWEIVSTMGAPSQANAHWACLSWLPDFNCGSDCSEIANTESGGTVQCNDQPCGRARVVLRHAGSQQTNLLAEVIEQHDVAID